MPHRNDDRERRRWRDMNEEHRWRHWDREHSRGQGMGRGYGREYDQGFDRPFENRGWDDDFDSGRSFRNRPHRGFGYEDEGLGGDYGWQGRLGSRDRGGYGEEYDAGRDLRRGTFYDRGASSRGNYELPEDRWSERGMSGSSDLWDEERGRGRFGRMGRSSGRGYDQDYGRGMSRSSDRGYGRGFEHGMDRSYGRGYGSDWERSGYQQDYDRDWGQNMGRIGYGDYDEYYYETEPEDWTYSELWQIPGPFTGMGPQGYQRSDDRIYEDICERLTQHGQIDPRNVEIKVQNGEVTLSGSVNNRHEKRMIEDTIETVSGVSDVQNQLRVSQMGRTGGQEHSQMSGRHQISSEQRGGQQTSGQQQTTSSTGTHSRETGDQSGSSS